MSTKFAVKSRWKQRYVNRIYFIIVTIHCDTQYRHRLIHIKYSVTGNAKILVTDNTTYSGGRAYVFLCFHFNFMQKFRFQYQFEGKGLENNFGPIVKLSDKKSQNGRLSPTWLPISSFLSQYPS